MVRKHVLNHHKQRLWERKRYCGRRALGDPVRTSQERNIATNWENLKNYYIPAVWFTTVAAGLTDYSNYKNPFESLDSILTQRKTIRLIATFEIKGQFNIL